MKDLEHIKRSDVSESDFIFNELRTILKKREEDMLWYIKEYFTPDEINRHSENLLRMVEGVEANIAEIKMKFLRSDSEIIVKGSKKLRNYIVSYTKDTTKTDVDVSIGSDNLDDLVKGLKSILSESEFDSIFKIETGPMSFG
jgi:hypothetical protein